METRIVLSIVKEPRERCSPKAHYPKRIVCLTVKTRRTGAHSLPLSRCLVEMSGIEPLTPCLQSRCSPI